MMVTFHFTWCDYLIFCSLIGFTGLIGIYYGCKRKKSEDDYLLGENTNIIGVAASMIASNIAGVAFVGIPSEVYLFGAMLIWGPICFIIPVWTAIHITMPVLLNIKSNSVFEYLELRFNRKLRSLASGFSVLYMILFNVTVIYVPSILLAQCFSITVTAVVGCLICVCYTTVGGLNAVIWSDFLQYVMMLTSLIAVFIIGVKTSGGFSAVWADSLKGGRLDVFKFHMDFTDRDSIWIVIFGYGSLSLLNTAVGQASFQRLVSLKSGIRAKRALYLYGVGSATTIMFTALIGLTIYAKYSTCDPLLNKKIQNYDQIVAYYVMDIGGYILGLPGLFIAGIYSAGLSFSTLSTNLNSLAAVIYSDFLTYFISKDLQNRRKDLILKLTVISVGGLSVILSSVVNYLGGLISLVSVILGICGAPLFGLYILGMVFPKSNSKGAVTGSISAVAFILWLTIGNIYYKHKGILKDQTKRLSTENCTFIGNNTAWLSSGFAEEEELFILYRVSHFYYSIISIFLTIAIGFLISLITRNKEDTVREDLITPMFRFLLPQAKAKDPLLHNNLEQPLTTVFYELQ